LKKIKGSIVKLKDEMKEIALNEGIMLNMLFSSSNMKQGKHHLYDDIDDINKGFDSSFKF